MLEQHIKRESKVLDKQFQRHLTAGSTVTELRRTHAESWIQYSFIDSTFSLSFIEYK